VPVRSVCPRVPVVPDLAIMSCQEVPRQLGERVQEKLSLIQGFLQADVRDQLSELEAKLRCEELSEVRPGWQTNLGLSLLSN
uniref:Uncharacterized protein n=1 Tax=Anser brachyrhynchus TaxID=132585 RepID=A0A8B9BA01_9AVES